jgi:mitochondrial import inner membrane translocase subunit TIM50
MLAARSLSRLNVVRAGTRSTSIALNITSTRCKSNLVIISPLIRHSTLLRQIDPSKPVSFSRLSAVRWQSSGGSGPQNPDKPSSPSASSPKEQKTPVDGASVGETSAQQGISIDGDTPLPDLRQGIPSTFAAEYLKQEPGKEESAEKRHELDITDQDAETEGTKSSRRGGRGETPRSAYETSIDKRRAAVARYFYMLWAASMIGGTVYYGRNWDTDEEERAHPDAPSGWGAMLMYNRVKTRVSEYLGYYTEPTFPKLLPIVKDQNIPPYTLVISLEDMLVHSEWSRDHGWRTAKRPGVDFFLLYLSQYYELCLFTTVQSAMGDPIVRKLDPFHVIMWPLFREATRYENGDYVKVCLNTNMYDCVIQLTE